MTEPENREPKPEAPKPEPPNQAWISPRLREKLGDATGGGGGGGDDYEFLERGAPTGLIITVVILALAAVGIWWMIHVSQVKAKQELARAAKAAAEAHAAAVRDSLAAAAHADSLRAQAVADSIAFAKLPKWKQRQILAAKAKKAAAAAAAASPAPKPAAATGASKGAAAAAGARAADTSAKAPPAPVEKGPFVIDAAQFLDEAQANQEAEALKTKTSLPASVVGVAVGGATSYHVYLGKYTSRGRAEAAAGKLFDSGSITQAAVVPQPAAAPAAPSSPAIPAPPATPAAPDSSH